LELEITDCRDQVEAKSKAFASIAKAFTQNTKDFQHADGILDQDMDYGKRSSVCTQLDRLSRNGV
jgi:hypothetical protein